MSKAHVEDGQTSIDDELDNYIQTHQVKPVVASTDNSIDLFGGSTPQKKKSLLHRLLTRFLNLFSPKLVN